MGTGVATPLMSSHSASVTSNTNSGSHMSHVTPLNQLPAPAKNPRSCSERITTTRADASTPSQASGTGIIRPRSRSQEKSVLATAQKIALLPSPLRRYAPSACVAPPSGAFTPGVVANQSRASVLDTPRALLMPSTTRHVRATMARSGSCSRVNRVEGHAQHQGRESGEQVERRNDAHLCRVLGDAREFRCDHVSADRPGGQDEAGNADYDVEEEGEAGDSCI